MSLERENAIRLGREGMITGALIADRCGAVYVARKIRTFTGSCGTSYQGGLITAAELAEECGAVVVANKMRDQARNVELQDPRA